MVKVISVRNVNAALFEGLRYLAEHGVEENSRNGAVLVAPGPVVTEYAKPRERVLLHFARDANPFFHLFEALWMLAGRNDLGFLLQLNKRMREYSDDGGKTMNGAYGFRWLHYFRHNQLATAIRTLREEPNTRRVVVAMWDATSDQLNSTSRDLPCNTHIYFDRRGGRLNMTVCNRSNDIYWGAYGANAVHFSILQEYIAAAVEVPVGTYYQFSNNYHLYTDIIDPRKPHPLLQFWETRYSQGIVQPFPLVQTSIDEWFTDLVHFMWCAHASVITSAKEYRDPFFRGVVTPMYNGWFKRRRKLGGWTDDLASIEASDWRAACLEWTERRENQDVKTS